MFMFIRFVSNDLHPPVLRTPATRPVAAFISTICISSHVFNDVHGDGQVGEKVSSKVLLGTS
jgi:hypothetical protein